MTPLLDVRGLTVAFGTRPVLPWRTAAPLIAVDDVSLSVHARETVGLVGESGSGKTTLSRAILRLVPARAGSVHFDGNDVLAASRRDLRALRRRMQIVFQDPYASLNPRMTAGQSVAEGLRIQGAPDARERARALLAELGLPPDSAACMPHEFSGGQRQRIGIARALATEPAFLIADEPVSALDMSIRAQILNLLLDQQERRGLAILFIGHDLSVIRHVCDRAIVLYRGQVMESAPVETLFRAPAHPYTRALLDAAPAAHPSRRRPAGVSAPAPATAATGCRYAPRCPNRIGACEAEIPALREVGEGHAVRCIRVS